MSEDCLRLNVWSPAKAANDKLPVMVWIHGGGFRYGSGSHPTYDGEALAGRGVVVVNLEAMQDACYEQLHILSGVRLIGLSDVNSPLCGPTGATYVFGPQKGVKALAVVDATLARFAAQCTAAVGQDFTNEEGSGAAGGIGYALRLLGAEIVSGAAFVVGAAGLQGALGAFDWVITGEGRSDAQTMMGKGPAMVAGLARHAGVPVSLLSGAVEPSVALTEAFDGCVSIQQAPVSLSFAMENAGELLEDASLQLARLFASARRARARLGC